MSLATCDGSRLWHGDITSPFPPSGNEGYVCNQDVPYLSVTRSYAVTTLGVHGKCHNLNTSQPCGAANLDMQPCVRQMLRKGHNLPNAPTQIR